MDTRVRRKRIRNSVAGGLNQAGFGHFGFGHSPRGVIVDLIIQPGGCGSGAISVMNVSDFVERTVLLAALAERSRHDRLRHVNLGGTKTR